MPAPGGSVPVVGPRRHGRTFALTATIAGLLLGSVLGLTGCGDDTRDASAASSAPDQPTKASRPTDPATVTIRQGEITRYDSLGRPVWDLRADTIRYERETQTSRAQSVTLTLHVSAPTEAETASQSGPLTLQAETLTLDHTSQDLHLSGNVRGHRSDEMRLRTEAVRWQAESGVLIGKQPVRIVRDTARLTGQGFRYVPAEGRLTVQSASLTLDSPDSSNDSSNDSDGTP